MAFACCPLRAAAFAAKGSPFVFRRVCNVAHVATSPVNNGGTLVEYACDRKVWMSPSLEELSHSAEEVLTAAAVSDFRRAMALLQASQSSKAGCYDAVALLESAAHTGVADAAHMLGLLVYNGRGVARDKARAAELFEFAAGHGVAKAALNFGIMLYHGHGVQSDKAKAVEFFESAASQGVAKAALILGRMLDRGDGVPQDKARALQFFEAAKLAVQPSQKEP